jgi:hypothetical protein
MPEIVPDLAALELLRPHIRGGTFAPGVSRIAVSKKLAEIGLQSFALESLYEWHNGFAPEVENVLPDLFGMVFEPLEKGIETFQMLRTIERAIPEPWFGSPTWFPVFRFLDSGIVFLDTVTDLALYLHDRDYGVSEDSIPASQLFEALIKQANSQPGHEAIGVPDSWSAYFTTETP